MGAPGSVKSLISRVFLAPLDAMPLKTVPQTYYRVVLK